jgi:transcriptional regulator
VFIHQWDRPGDDREWCDFVAAQGFGELVAAGAGRQVAVVVPTQFVIEDDQILVHLLAQNPIWAALEENPTVLLAVSGDWAFIPSAWKAIHDEDPALGIPTTYYASVQLTGTARIVADPDGVAAVLRSQLARLQPEVAVVDPSEHGRRLGAIRAARIDIEEVRAKFKYGGNVDAAHRQAAAERLEARGGPGDLAAAAHVRGRLDSAEPDIDSSPTATVGP